MSIFNQFMKRYFFLVIPAVVYVSLTSFSPEKAPRHLRRLAQFQTSNPKNLRYLTFGTSRTYGSGIPSRMNAFPYLLSPEANNLAIRAAGPGEFIFWLSYFNASVRQWEIDGKIGRLSTRK